MKFTEFIKKRREILGLTQAELARRLGTRTAYVGLMELGKRRPKKVTSLEKLRTALEIEERDSGWFFRFITYEEKPEVGDKYLKREVFYQEPVSRNVVITEDSPAYQAFSSIVNHPSVDQDQLLQVLTLMQDPAHPISQVIALLLDQPTDVVETLLQRLRFELQLISRK